MGLHGQEQEFQRSQQGERLSLPHAVALAGEDH